MNACLPASCAVRVAVSALHSPCYKKIETISDQTLNFIKHQLFIQCCMTIVQHFVYFYRPTLV